ncbi:MAG: anaerobic ribonucleoside-triphosphate reductase activating protein [Clostridia bacterium]|nr:anaerobic ribonucleoside-triphosphate reductase activating protein [Clostridia bacterium]
MIIHGLQKMTLLDFPGRVACTVFLGGCEFRCPFCHNSELLDMTAPGVMDDGELLRFLKTRQGLLDGVAITGGEPLLRRDLPQLLRSIRALGYKVKLDTNGNHPEALSAVLEEGLVDYVAMDIKNSPEKYARTVGLQKLNLGPINESIQLLLHGSTPYEFRTTVVEELHTRADFEAIGPWIFGAKAYYLQAFTDRDSVPFGGLHAPTREQLEEYSACMQPFVQYTAIRGVD